ncbi:MAG: NADPH-dependent assimilatory sulfite reductase hemoprotein subunit [Taibaiella sp.]|nr:NADPH-dependent assimilatory sulfite reductase hemoprotein subunit [Taibaiella sp.]
MSKKLSPIEAIKIKSDGLRGTIKASIEEDNHSGTVRADDEALVKFHGMYVQDNRDRRAERAAKKLDKLYSFMIRLRIPGGLIDAGKWLAIHDTSEQYGTGVLKITTRQTIQLHGILKHQLRPTLQSFDRAALDAIAACGDVNRNVIASSHPLVSPAHARVHAYADKLSKHLLPKTQAYYEIFVDDQKIYEREAEQDDLYENRYLPRKFKIAIAIPPANDVDVFANDIGLIAIIENGILQGFNIAIGGGLARTHGNANTYSRLATVIGFLASEEDVLKACYEVLTIQRDYGNREDRKLSRLKYTVDKLGLATFKTILEERIGFALQPPRPYNFSERADADGWQQLPNERWYYTLQVEHGVVNPQQKAFLYELAQLNICNFIFTANQNLLLGEIKPENKPIVEALLQKYRIQLSLSGIRKNSMACVALPTCPLALAEGQRYLPELVSKIEPILSKYAIEEEPISIRMTGCPNGCGRSYLAEIGLVGTAAGEYNLMIGGDRFGLRLNQLYKEKIKEPEILTEIDKLLKIYVDERKANETLGDFSYRKYFSKT